MPDWAAIGAIAAVLAVVIAWLQLRKTSRPVFATGTASKDVEFYATRILAQIPDEVVKKANLGETRITTDQLLIRNISGRDIANVRLRASRRKNIWDASVGWTKNLSEKAVRISVEDDTILIALEDLPAGEAFAVNIVSVDWSILSLQLHSDNSSVVLKEASAPFTRYA